MKIRNNNRGQSTIEFILTFTIAVGFIFLFLKMALNYTNGFMVHYATYNAARAYLVNDDLHQSDAHNDNQAEVFAKKVFKKYMPEALMPGIEVTIKAQGAGGGVLPLFTGMYAEFSQKFSLGLIGGKESINLRSEAFLGREPTRTESTALTCEAIKSGLGLTSCSVHATLDDNGG